MIFMTLEPKTQRYKRLRQSIEKAFKFIETNRNQDGLWSDFLTLAGESTDWVSGYVGYSIISNSQTLEERNLLQQVASTILTHQKSDGGWGYTNHVPSDADSTSWCLRFFSKLEVQNQTSREKALQFLLKHQSEQDGGFRTYSKPQEIARYMMLKEDISFEGWASSQMCVTAVAVQALMENESTKGVNEAIDHIKKGQTAEGYWNPYWWSGKLYATVNCMEALKAKENKDSTLINNAQRWIANAQMENGEWRESPVSDECSPFQTALGLRGLLIEPDKTLPEKITNSAKWLLDQQLPDGSWNCSHILRIPHPAMKEPWNQPYWTRDGRAINALIKDHKRLFTTATVYRALKEFENKFFEK